MSNSIINTTASGSVKFPSKFYDRQLLESAKTRLVHQEFGQKRSIPANSGKYVNFRRWNLFDPAAAVRGRSPRRPRLLPKASPRTARPSPRARSRPR